MAASRTYLSIGSVEAFDEAVLHWTAGLDVLQVDVVFVSPRYRGRTGRSFTLRRCRKGDEDSVGISRGMDIREYSQLAQK
jgi:hypothetical protein